MGGDCAVAVRLAVDELLGTEGIRRDGEGREIVEMLAELPDLWDVNVSDWANDSRTSRFAQEDYQEDFVRFVKSARPNPSWVSADSPRPTPWCRRSAAAFSISSAPPALPSRIPSCRGRSRRATWTTFANASGAISACPATTRCPRSAAPRIRPWARNGARAGIPRSVPPGSEDDVLVVGAGPAGLECARVLGQRGYRVHLAEAGEQLGGRVAREVAPAGPRRLGPGEGLPPASIEKESNVEIHPPAA